MIDNYIDLRFAVSDLVSNRIMSDVFPRLVKAAEVTFNQKLRTAWQVQEDTLYFDGGSAELPFDFLEVLTLGDAQGRPTHSGPCTYQIGNGTVMMRGVTGERALTYYAQMPTLVSSPLACNWLLQKYPNAYLYGAGYEAAKFLRDADQANTINSLLGGELSAIRIDDERARYSKGVVRVASYTP